MFRGSQPDFFVTTRASRSEPFGTPTLLASLNTPWIEEFATVTADGLTVYIDSNRRAGYFGLYVSTRGSTTQAFPTPIEVTDLNIYGEGAPYITPDGSAIYFHSVRDHISNDIYRAKKTATGFATPVSLSINTPGNEGRPVVSADELTIYFFFGGETTGIGMATRSSVADPFGPPIDLAEINNLLQYPYPFWISPDGCRLYFGDQDEVESDFSVYVAERIAGSVRSGGVGGTGGVGGSSGFGGSGGAAGTGGSGGAG